MTWKKAGLTDLMVTKHICLLLVTQLLFYIHFLSFRQNLKKERYKELGSNGRRNPKKEIRKEVCNAKNITELLGYIHKPVQFCFVCKSSVKVPVLYPASTSSPCRIRNKLFQQVSEKQ